MIGLLLAGVMPPRPRPQPCDEPTDRPADLGASPPPAWWRVENRVLAALAEHTRESDPWTAAKVMFWEDA